MCENSSGSDSFWKTRKTVVPGRAVRLSTPVSVESSFQDPNPGHSSMLSDQLLPTVHSHSGIIAKEKFLQSKSDGNTKEKAFSSSSFNFSFLESNCEENKILPIVGHLKRDFLDLNVLRRVCWFGIPPPVKADAWRLLVGYAPPALLFRQKTVLEKRLEYWKEVSKHYSSGPRDCFLLETLKQIQLDVPRMSPAVDLFRHKDIQETFQRILYVWVAKNSSFRYLQGINDLVTPFFLVFLQEFLPDVSSKVYRSVEADSYWCFSEFMDCVQDNYRPPRLGVQQTVTKLREVVRRIDAALHGHLEAHGVEYVLFCYRWLNNLLTRELPLPCVLRLWDTFLCELEDLPSFLLFVCAAFLLRWRRELLLQKDFQGLLLFLLNLPTEHWGPSDMDLLVAEAFVWKSTFADTLSNLSTDQSLHK